MQKTHLLRTVAFVLAASSLLACGPRETPEQHLNRLRKAHEIVATGATTIHNDLGDPTLVVDLRVTNQSAERLDHLTIVVRVENADGVERLSRPVTLDLSTTRPGVGVQMAALIEGFELAEDYSDMVTVEITGDLTDEQLRSLPEFADLPQ